MLKSYNDACKMIEIGNYKNAEEILNNILLNDPQDYKAINKLGVIYSVQDDIEKARVFFETCLSLKPDYAPAIVNMGNIFQQLGDYQKALQMYSYAIEKDMKCHLAYYNLSILHRKMGNYNKYIKLYKEYKRLYKKSINEASRTEDVERIKGTLSWFSGIKGCISKKES